MRPLYRGRSAAQVRQLNRPERGYQHAIRSDHEQLGLARGFHIPGALEELPRQIKQVALDYGLMSAFTAFVAVDSTRRTKGTGAATVPVAVTVPEGVNYETTVSGEK